MRVGLLAAILVLGGGAAAAPDAEAGGVLALSGGGRPTLIVGAGARLDSVDPDTPNMGCSGAKPGPATYVRRPDGSWLDLPYKVAAYRSASCSPEGEVVALIADRTLTTARLDRPERKTIRSGLGKEVPVAWLP